MLIHKCEEVKRKKNNNTTNRKEEENKIHRVYACVPTRRSHCLYLRLFCISSSTFLHTRDDYDDDGNDDAKEKEEGAEPKKIKWNEKIQKTKNLHKIM